MIPAADMLRAGGVAALAVLVARLLRPVLAGTHRGAWAWLLAPYLMPSLLVGYAYASFSLSLVHYPTANAALYALLLVGKLAPVAALALAFAPPPLTAEAWHCRRLALRPVGGAGAAQGSVPAWLREGFFWWRAGCGRAPLLAFALVFLLAFGDFELASLLAIRTWTVRLFDGHAGGLPLTQSLVLAAGPFLVEAAVLGVVLVLVARQTWKRPEGTMPRIGQAWAGWAWLVAASGGIVLIPCGIVLHGTLQGWRVLLENFALGREILTSLLLGVAAAALAYFAAPRRWVVALGVSVPGLLGPLVLALLVGGALQTGPLVLWRDTPLPLLVTLGLLLLPLAVLLRQLLRHTAPATSVHTARLLGGAQGRRLIWRLSTRRKAAAFFLLFCWAYLELTVSAILAPTGITPVSVRLYNLMHYGRTAMLSAMVLATVAAPLLVMLAVLASRRLWLRTDR